VNEKELQSRVIELAHNSGWGVIRLNSVSRGLVRSYHWWDAKGLPHTTGASDLLICRDGKLLFFEVKRSIKAKSNKGTESSQGCFREWCQRWGMKCYRIDSIEAAAEALNSNW